VDHLPQSATRRRRRQALYPAFSGQLGDIHGALVK
jgi:hypothetical protein